MPVRGPWRPSLQDATLSFDSASRICSAARLLAVPVSPVRCQGGGLDWGIIPFIVGLVYPRSGEADEGRSDTWGVNPRSNDSYPSFSQM